MNKYIDYFELTETYREIKPYKLPFKAGLNVIVGENGSGKSTLFHIMENQKRPLFNFEGFSIGLTNPGDAIEFRSFDTEKMNPRVSQQQQRDNAIFSFQAAWVSHGEAMLPILEWCKKAQNASDMLIFIDEPEAGISLGNQKKLFRVFKAAEKNGCQVIITTHSYVLIKSAKRVFDLDTREWVPSDEYLQRTLGKSWIKIPAKKGTAGT